jgi:hypothetical protein
MPNFSGIRTFYVRQRPQGNGQAKLLQGVVSDGIISASYPGEKQNSF